MKIKVMNADLFSWYLNMKGKVFEVVQKYGEYYLKEDVDKGYINPRKFEARHIKVLKGE